MMILSVFVSTAFAQQGPLPGGGQGRPPHRTPEEMAKRQVERMSKDITLDEATQKKVYEVALKYSRQSSEEMQKLMAAGDREAMKAKMAGINSERDKEFKAIIGDKKFEIYKAKEEERRKEMMKQRPNN